jgi:2-methylcitrate dehydratase PrpD
MREQLSLTDQLAEYWANARYEDLPADVVAAAKRALMDTLSVAVRGAESEIVQITQRGATAMAETSAGSALVWGSGASLPPALAALVNGTAAHAYEFDDYGGCGHSGAVVVPAVCALADREGADGRAVLLAIAAGYDLAARVTEGAGGYRAHNDLGWHSTGTCGTFGAAAGAASILGLDTASYRSALGIAGSYAGGTWAFLVDGAMTKKFHPGRAAENGVSAALLAAAGMQGPRYILDAAWGGFFATYCRDTATPEKTVQRLGEDFRIFATGVKPFPCCRGLHSSIEALLDVMQDNAIAADDIERMVVHGADRTVRQFRNYEVKTILDGQFSLPYALAAVADGGQATMQEFFPLRTDKPRVQALMQRVEVLDDRPLGPYDEPDIEVLSRSGAAFRHHVKLPKGGPLRPLDEAFLLRKHATTAVPAMGQDRFDALRAAIASLESLGDFRAISRLLVAT